MAKKRVVMSRTVLHGEDGARVAGILVVSTRTGMKTTIQKWGNSLAVRIPRPFAEEIHLAENTTVDLTIRSGKLVIVPAEPAITLESLVEQITDENRHDEIETGNLVGNEVW
jgi:antitoxin MazE